MSEYNFPYGSTIQDMDILHKGNHYKQKNAHPNHLFIMGGMYQTPFAQSVDINNYSKIATITGVNILQILVYSGVSAGSTTVGAYRLMIKVDPSNESANIYNLEHVAVVKLGFILVKNTSSGSTVYDLYAQILNTSDVIYFSPIFVKSEQNVAFNPYSAFVTLPANDATHTRIFFNIINFSQKVSATLNFPSIPANSTSELTITVTGAALGDSVMASPDSTSVPMEAGLVWSAHVTASNTVAVRLANVTTSAIDPLNRTWKVNWQK